MQLYSEARLFLLKQSTVTALHSKQRSKRFFCQKNASQPWFEAGSVWPKTKQGGLDVLLEESPQLQPGLLEDADYRVISGREDLQQVSSQRCQGFNMLGEWHRASPGYAHSTASDLLQAGTGWTRELFRERDVPLDLWCSRRRARRIFPDSGWSRCSWSRCSGSSRRRRKLRSTPTTRHNTQTSSHVFPTETNK